MLKTSTFRKNHQIKTDYMDRAYDYWGQQAYQYNSLWVERQGIIINE